MSIERNVPLVEVFAGHTRLWLPDSHVFWTRSRHRLSHRSQSIRETRHCRVQSSIRRLLPDFFHPCIELLELSSQQLHFLSGSHNHSIPPARLFCSATMQRVEVPQNAMCTPCNSGSFLVMRLGPKTSRCVMSVNVKTTVASCEVSNCDCPGVTVLTIPASVHNLINCSSSERFCTLSLWLNNRSPCSCSLVGSCL